MKSVIIGPAKHWRKFIVKNSKVEASDKVFYQITGIKADGTYAVLKNNLTTSTDIADISASDFPSLIVTVNIEDALLLTPANLDHWLVTFDPLPEGVTIYEGTKNKIALNEGESYKPQFKFVNISETAFPDSLTVKQTLQNPTTFKSFTADVKIKSPLPRDTTKFSLTFNTAGMEGMHDLTVNVNPKNTSELNYDNNIITLRNHLEVITDSSAPVLDVTIDGRHIQNEDYVMPSPKIKIMVWDNNPYLLKRDTTGVNIFLADFCDDLGCNYKRINFSRNDVTWKGETTDSEFEVNFTPADLPDGAYRLRVAATDAHGNKSGALPYEITFRVLNETTIVLSPPFPNPAYEKVNFELVLTGNTLPESVDLSFFSITGRKYQTFLLESDQFHIGTNTITWSTIDDRGNPLPNGVYVYDITVVADDRSINKKGKLVIVR